MNRFELPLRFLGVLSIVTSVQTKALSAEDDPGELRVRWELIGPRRIANPPFRSNKPEQQHLFGSGKTTSIAIHPTDSRIIYAGAGAWIGPPSSSGLHKSTDGGENWAPASRGLTDLAVEGLWLNPTNPSVLLASTNDGGIFRSVDAGENWTLRYRATEANSIASTPSGLYVSTSAGVVSNGLSGELKVWVF